MENRNFALSTWEKVQSFNTDVLIPAYDKNKNGIMFNLKMKAIPNDSLTIEAHGNVARSLVKNLGRAIAVLSNIDSSWKILKQFKYNLVSTKDEFRVMDARSSGLPLCIALINVARSFNGMKQVQHLTGTGILRIDGTFEKSHLEEEKKQASSQLMENEFINSQVCNHVLDLAILMNRQ